MNSAPSNRRAVFFSGEPQSVGHVYRVEHAVKGLRERGWQADWHPLDRCAGKDGLRSADIAVVFRAGWEGAFEEIRKCCSDKGVPLVYDTDDLIFEPALAETGAIALMEKLPPSARSAWVARIESYQRAIAASDAAVVTTEPLAKAARRLCRSVSVLPNVLGPAMWEWAQAATGRSKPSGVDGRCRLLFASGTPTHHRDFKVAAEAIALLFAKKKEPLLTIVGELEPADFPELRAFASRIEIRPRVPLSELFFEIARADINLCPLELENPFCDAKSAVRWLAASALAVPSIVSPTPPLREAVSEKNTGRIALAPEEWVDAMDELCEDAVLRAAMGQNAQIRAKQLCDFGKWGSLAASIFASIRCPGLVA